MFYIITLILCMSYYITDNVTFAFVWSLSVFKILLLLPYNSACKNQESFCVDQPFKIPVCTVQY